MERKIIISGANGFVGSHICEVALEKGFNVCAIVRRKSDLSYLKDLPIQLLEVSSISPVELGRAFREYKEINGEPDFFIHNAGLTKAKKADDFKKVNVNLTSYFIEAVKHSFPSLKKFVFMSSLAAHGPGDEMTMAEIRETDNDIPNTLYGKSKLEAEELVKNSGLPYTILRPTGVYGPRDKDYFLMLKTLLSGIDPQIGLKQQIISFIYVTDLAEALFTSLSHSSTNQTFIISDGKNYTNKEYSTLAKNQLGVKAVTLHIPKVIVLLVVRIIELLNLFSKKAPTLNYDKFLTMKAKNWKCSNEKIKEITGWTPKVELNQGLKKTITWYKENDWLK